MNLKKYFIYGILPFFIGIFFNTIVGMPLIGQFFYFFIPLATAAIWFSAGFISAKERKGPLIPFVCTHVFALISFILYYWQYTAAKEGTGNALLSTLSQMFFLPLVPYIAFFAKEQNNNPVEFTRMVMTLSFLFMLLLFILGYIFGFLFKRKREKLMRELQQNQRDNENKE